MSRRLDVPRDHLPPFLIPKEGTRLQENYKEPFVLIRDELEGFLRAASALVPRSCRQSTFRPGRSGGCAATCEVLDGRGAKPP